MISKLKRRKTLRRKMTGSGDDAFVDKLKSFIDGTLGPAYEDVEEARWDLEGDERAEEMIKRARPFREAVRYSNPFDSEEMNNYKKDPNVKKLREKYIKHIDDLAKLFKDAEVSDNDYGLDPSNIYIKMYLGGEYFDVSGPGGGQMRVPVKGSYTSHLCKSFLKDVGYKGVSKLKADEAYEIHEKVRDYVLYTARRM